MTVEQISLLEFKNFQNLKPLAHKPANASLCTRDTASLSLTSSLCLFCAIKQFDYALRDFLADSNPIRNADQVGIFEFYTRALVAIVK